jgi:hypothetical protein
MRHGFYGGIMNVNDVVSMIGSIGFPIVACCAMAWFIATTFRNFNDLVTKNNVLTEELIGLLQKGNDDDDDTSRVA